MTNLLNVKCRCHGVSGSCAVKTCWKSMPSFRRVGDGLKLKYENSVEISLSAKPALRHREKRIRRELIAETELVHVTRSPNYCKHNARKGIVGTRGRECKKSSQGPDSCHSLCCGRGYNTHEVRFVERCHCRFIWCCQVKCKTCEVVVEKYICK
jgi:wingless-type MMTV integration site family, member 16